MTGLLQVIDGDAQGDREALRRRLARLRGDESDDPSAARAIAATVGAAVESAMREVVPYSSQGRQFEGSAEIEHVEPGGAVTRARLKFSYT